MVFKESHSAFIVLSIMSTSSPYYAQKILDKCSGCNLLHSSKILESGFRGLNFSSRLPSCIRTSFLVHASTFTGFYQDKHLAFNYIMNEQMTEKINDDRNVNYNRWCSRKFPYCGNAHHVLKMPPPLQGGFRSVHR